MATDAKFISAIQSALATQGVTLSNSQALAVATDIIARIGNPKFYALPDVVYTQVDSEEVANSVITMYEGILNITLYPGDPVRLFLSTLATIIAQQNAVLDHTGKQNLLRYARTVFLDHLGAFLNVYRLDEEPAKTILKFTLIEPRAVNTVIPIDTRATPNGSIFFATDNLLVIEAGKTSGEVSATCLTYGISGNGFIKGEINKLFKSIANISKVSNVEPSTGGSNIEEDDDFLLRIRLAPEGFTTAGSELSYIYWALTAHGNIGDVSVFSPLPGFVNVFIMLKGGGIPEAAGAEITAVKEVLNEKTHRPLTDFVSVYPINYEPVDYTVTWYITSENATLFNEINERMIEAVKKYEEWQVAMAGRDVIPDRLKRLCLEAGAKRTELDGLYFTVIDPSSVVNFIANPNRIVFGGVESE